LINKAINYIIISKNHKYIQKLNYIFIKKPKTTYPKPTKQQFCSTMSSLFVEVVMCQYGVLMPKSCTTKKTKPDIESFLTERIGYNVSFGSIFGSTKEGFNRAQFTVDVPMEEYSSANKAEIFREIEKKLDAALTGFSLENSAKIILNQYSEIQTLRAELEELKSTLASK